MASVLIKLHTAGFSILAVLHSTALLLLCKSRWELKNQKLLAVNLVLVEMLYIYCMVIINSIDLSDTEYSTPLHLTTVFFSTLMYTEIRMAVLHIIMDRFMEIFLNIKYPIYMSLKRMKSIVVCSWTLCAIFASAATACFAQGKIIIAHTMVDLRSLILDTVILISAVTTYSYFYSTVKKIQKRERRTSTLPNEIGSSLVIQKFKLPCFIVSTYIMFNFTSTIIAKASEYAKTQEKQNLILDISVLFAIAGFFADIFIYVLVNKNVRRLLFLKRRTLRTFLLAKT